MLAEAAKRWDSFWKDTLCCSDRDKEGQLAAGAHLRPRPVHEVGHSPPPSPRLDRSRHHYELHPQPPPLPPPAHSSSSSAPPPPRRVSGAAGGASSADAFMLAPGVGGLPPTVPSLPSSSHPYDGAGGLPPTVPALGLNGSPYAAALPPGALPPAVPALPGAPDGSPSLRRAFQAPPRLSSLDSNNGNNAGRRISIQEADENVKDLAGYFVSGAGHEQENPDSDVDSDVSSLDGDYMKAIQKMEKSTNEVLRQRLEAEQRGAKSQTMMKHIGQYIKRMPSSGAGANAAGGEGDAQGISFDEEALQAEREQRASLGSVEDGVDGPDQEGLGSTSPGGAMLPSFTEDMNVNVTSRWNRVLGQNNNKLHNILNKVKDNPDRKKLNGNPRANRRRRNPKVSKEMVEFVDEYKGTMKERLKAIGVPDEQLEEDNMPIEAGLANRVLHHVLAYHTHCENLGKNHYTFDQDDDEEEERHHLEDDESEDDDEPDDAQALSRLTQHDKDELKAQKEAKQERKQMKVERLADLMSRRERLPQMLEAVQDELKT